MYINSSTAAGCRKAEGFLGISRDDMLGDETGCHGVTGTDRTQRSFLSDDITDIDTLVTDHDRLTAVIEDGKVTEHGTHDELLALNGSYARMYRIQSTPIGGVA